MLALMTQAVAMGNPGGPMTVLEATTGIAELAVDGSRAVATAMNNHRYRQKDTHGWYGAKDAEHEIQVVSRGQETWVQTDRGWRLQANQLLGNKTYVDGALLMP